MASARRRAVAAAPTVAAALAALDRLAPFACAASWDNVGLLAGRPEWPARRGLLAIDLTDAVAEEALRAAVDLLVVYHPPIFKDLRRVTPDAEAPTRRLPDLLAARVSIIALHTALDAAVGGTNDALLDAFDLVARRPLEPLVDETGCKLVVFVPPDEVDRLRAALSAAGAGVIGHYSECGYELRGRGSFRGDERTNPAVGRRQRLEFVEEARLEMVVPRRGLGDVVRALYANHSYEEPAFDLYPTRRVLGRGAAGMGRVGQLRRPQTGAALLQALGQRVDLSIAAVVGSPRRRFRSVVAAAGAFGVREFGERDALYLTGEFKHHDALALLKRGVTAVALGHDASERPALESVRRRMLAALPALKLSRARMDRSPLRAVRI